MTHAEPAPSVPDALARQVAFDVVDTLGLATLEKRSATLDGSVPLRVAQACVPLLEGNALGFQITLARPLDVRTRLGSARVRFADEESLTRLHRASLPMLAATGIVAPGSDDARALERGIVDASRGLPPRVRLFTGLFVRPRDGVRLRVSSTKNRRSLAYDVVETFVEARAPWTPLFVTVEPRGGDFTLAGEIATLMVLPEDTSLRVLSLDDAPEVARAHVAFYDQAYFATKRAGEVARKYRRARSLDPDAEGAAARLDCVLVGAPDAAPRLHADRVTITNAVAFDARFDGYRVEVEPEASDLAAHAAAIESVLGAFLAREPESAAHPGARLYLSKYVTPHPAGEPHFFVKPSVLFRTPPGVSLVIEGRGGPDHEIMRGVVESDRFHAAPAVFHLTTPGARVSLPRGAPLADLFPVSRALLAATFASRREGPLGGLALEGGFS